MTLKDFVLFSWMVSSEENHSKKTWNGQYNILDDDDKEHRNPSKTLAYLQIASIHLI